MSSRINNLFQTKSSGILSVFYTAGYPALQDTIQIAVDLEKAGVDMIEIGIPFSDPVADGPVIQASNKVALDNGMTLALLLEQLKVIRQTVRIPIILMGYVNPVLQYGYERFCKDAAAAGADGLILPDLPLDVYEKRYKAATESAGLVNVFLISPTTSEERIRRIDAVSGGFIYAVSASSTTGTRSGFTTDQTSYFQRLKDMSLTNPLLIGFGISDQSTFHEACRYASGAIVGSAFIKLIGSAGGGLEGIEGFVRGLRSGG
ncbi:MAG: tryptophan synthase subunit alpha [Bacteroidota bacterium]